MFQLKREPCLSVLCVSLIYSLFHWGINWLQSHLYGNLMNLLAMLYSVPSPVLNSGVGGERHSQSVCNAGRSIASSLQRTSSSFSVGQERDKSGVIEDCDPHDPSSLYLLVHSRVTINTHKNAIKEQEII